VIERFNEAFGLEPTDADRLHVEGIAADMIADPVIQQQAAANSKETFENPFGDALTGAVVGRMKGAEELTYRILDDDAFRAALSEEMLPRVWERARVANQRHCPFSELIARGEDQHLELKSTL
jgi:hypothetical protein